MHLRPHDWVETPELFDISQLVLRQNSEDSPVLLNIFDMSRGSFHGLDHLRHFCVTNPPRLIDHLRHFCVTNPPRLIDCVDSSVLLDIGENLTV